MKLHFRDDWKTLKTEKHDEETLDGLESSVHFRLTVGVGDFQCDTGTEAYFGKGTKLTVLEDGHNVTRPTVKVLPPSKKECGRQKEKKKTIVCLISGFYPDHVKVRWTIGEVSVTSGVSTDNVAKKEGNFYRMSSRLRVPVTEWYNVENEFTCIVSFYDGETWVKKSDFVRGQQDTTKGGFPKREKYLKITNGAKLTYTIFIVKSCFYGAFVLFLLLKLQGGKQKN
ncbi:M1-specific T cell receptor beta chain-like [Xyrichtys novacula]|nr:M1-specific T cell receptor beta chain-like [Xyrichtys novacula]